MGAVIALGDGRETGFIGFGLGRLGRGNRGGQWMGKGRGHAKTRHPRAIVQLPLTLEVLAKRAERRAMMLCWAERKEVSGFGRVVQSLR